MAEENEKYQRARGGHKPIPPAPRLVRLTAGTDRVKLMVRLQGD
jgi:hypothetical protein